MTRSNAFTNESEGVIGSRISVKEEHLLELVQWLKESLCTALASDDLILAHNACALYSYSFIVLCSGHRDVTDPHHDLDGFNANFGLTVISDKVVDEHHKYRIAVLPSSAFDQLERYRHHLESLAVRLPAQHQDLAAEILSITIQKGKRPLPLFFFLSDDFDIVQIRPKELSLRLGNFWELPVNSNRHILADYLHELGCAAEHIEAQLGHHDTGCNPFGPYSPFSPVGMVKNLQEPLEKYTQRIGLLPIDGFRLYRGRGLPSIRAKLSTVSSKKLGPELRQEKRQESWRKDSHFIREMIENALDKGATELAPTTIEQMINNLAADENNSGKRFIIRYELLRRHLLSKRRKGIKLILPGRLAISHSDPSPFEVDTLVKASQTVQLQKEFSQELDRRGKTSPTFTSERRIAEILISAALNGALLFDKALNNLPAALESAIYQFEGSVWIDITLEPNIKRSPIRRWLPDETSTPLITGWQQYICIRRNLPINHELIIDEVELLLGILLHKKKNKKQKPLWNTLKPLIKISTAFYNITLPQILVRYATGDHLSPSLLPDAWARMLTNRRLNQYPSEAISLKKKDYGDSALTLRQPENISLQLGRIYWKKLQDIVNVNATDKGDKKNKAVKRYIAQRALKFIHTNTGLIPNIVLALAGWSIHICKHGSPFKGDLVKTTISGYVGSIGKLIVEYAYEVDFLALDEERYTDIYCQIVSASNRTDKCTTARSLYVFHEYLVSTFMIDDIDWGEVYPNNCNTLFPVDSGFVTHDEYISTLDYLSCDSLNNIPAFVSATAYLIIAYNFGLRPGELRRLRTLDLQYSDALIVVIIRNTKEGVTKTENGVRQIPLCKSLTQNELDFLKRFIGRLSAIDVSADTPIFSRNDTDNNFTASPGQIVLEALRTVTGDQNVRLRHLRHSYASRNCIALIADSNNELLKSNILKNVNGHSSPDHVRKILLGRPELSRRSSYALSTALGHGGPAVGLNSYIHLLDIALNEAVSNSKATMSGRALAYAYSISNNYLRVIRSRTKHPESTLYHTLIKRLPEIDVEFSTEPPPQLQLSELNSASIISLQNIDRLLWKIARRNGQTDGIAEIFLTNENTVSLIVETAKQLQHETGYKEFGIPDHILEINMPSIWPSSSFSKENVRTRKFLGELDEARLKAPETFAKHAGKLQEIWFHSYHKNSLLFSDEIVLQEFYKTIQYFGINPSTTELVFSNVSTLPNAIDVNLRNTAETFSVPVKTSNSLPCLIHRSSELRNIRAGVTFRAGCHGFGYQRSFNRISYVISVWRAVYGDPREILL